MTTVEERAVVAAARFRNSAARPVVLPALAEEELPVPAASAGED